MKNTQNTLPNDIECYWVLPGRLIAGEYPGSKYFEQQTRQTLDSLLDLGLTTFIDLTEPGELPPYNEILQEEAGWMGKLVHYQRFPILDFKPPTKIQMEKILNFIEIELLEQHMLYIHCYAGIGRTGTVVGCFLGRYLSIGGEQALSQIKELRSLLPSGSFRSPQSDAQVRMVKNWK